MTFRNMLVLPRLRFLGRRIAGVMLSFGGGGGRLRLLLASSFPNLSVLLASSVAGIGGVSGLPSATCGISSTWLRRFKLAFLLVLRPLVCEESSTATSSPSLISPSKALWASSLLLAALKRRIDFASASRSLRFRSFRRSLRVSFSINKAHHPARPSQR